VARTALQRFLALGLLCSLSAHAASPVWAIRGAHTTVYLAGSVHLLPAQEASLPPGFERAYGEAGRLVMELDLSKIDPIEAAGWMSEHGALPEGRSLRDVIGPDRYARVSTAAARLGLPQAIFDRQAPWVVGIELADLEYVHLGMNPQQGVEEQLLQRAQTDGKTVSGLESLDEELGGLESLPHEDQLKLLDQTLEDLKQSEGELKAVLGAWRRGDADALAAQLGQEYQAFPALYKALVSARNQRWLPQIERLIRGDASTLVVVGALHLVGDGGLLELLRRDGFSATQLP
jgi:uncharacterized protein YbaP (TraB family)